MCYDLIDDMPRSVDCLENSLRIDRDDGDWEHEASVLFFLSIVYASLGILDAAIGSAESCLQIRESTGHPKARTTREHVDRLRTQLVRPDPNIARNVNAPPD
jgi:hypothetical protein